jgi:beta-glucosidase
VLNEADGLTVEVNVRNAGPVAGKEVVQLYVHERCAKVVRPEKELKAFTKVALQPGEGQTVRFELDRRAFAYYDGSTHGWVVNPGQFDLLAPERGSSGL